MHPYLRYQAIPMFPQLKVRTREQSRATGRPRERSLFPVGSQPQRLAAGDLRHGILRRRRSVLVEDNLVALASASGLADDVRQLEDRATSMDNITVSKRSSGRTRAEPIWSTDRPGCRRGTRMQIWLN
jgi:hypothetical protein